MRPSLKRLTSCRYVRATEWSGSGSPLNGIASFFQYCRKTGSESGPIASTSAPWLVNCPYASRRRANCARQCGHIKPRRKERTTGLPRKSDKRMLLPSISCSSKSGASSPGVINLLIRSFLSGILRWLRQPAFAAPRARWLLRYRRVENHNRRTARGSRRRSPRILS